MIKRLIKRVVVTGVGDSPGAAAATAFKRHGWLVVGVDHAFRPSHVHQFYLVSPVHHPGWVDELLLLVRRERSTLVVPTRREEFLPLARRQREFPRAGASLYLPLPDTVEDILDARLVAHRLRRAGLVAEEPWNERRREDRAGRLFEAALCRDVGASQATMGCAVFELFDNGDAPVRAERRKDEAEVEAVAQQAAEAMGVTGPATVHIRRDADGGLSVVEMTLSPCVHGPLANEVLDALVQLWERDQPA